MQRLFSLFIKEKDWEAALKAKSAILVLKPSLDIWKQLETEDPDWPKNKKNFLIILKQNPEALVILLYEGYLMHTYKFLPNC